MSVPDENLCPIDLKEDFLAYLNEGVPPGGFVRAVLENNLLEAFKRADAENRDAMPHIVAWIYWHMPTPAYGSLEAVREHLARFKRTEVV